MPFPLESFQQMQGFFWVLMRVSILFFLLPLFGEKGFPGIWKVGLSVVVAIVVTPVVPPPQNLPQTLLGIVTGLASEVLLGLGLGFVVKMAFASVQLAGQFMAFQMGFAMASTVDPLTGTQNTDLSQFLYLFTLLIFFTIDGHHILLQALVASFQMVPPNSLHLNPSLCGILAKASSQMFLIALKIAAPIMIALFLSNLCLGIVARTVPQVNILMIGFPINIGLGLILFGLTLSVLPPLLTDLSNGIGETLLHMLRLM